MRRVNSDNHFYGEFLVDRLVWIEIKTKGINIDGEKSTNNKLELNYKAILQITSWRFIFTVLNESISTHKSYWDFSWSDIEKISSSINWLTLMLKDKCIICIKLNDAHLASIKLWAFSEALKTEEQNCIQTGNGDVWAQGPLIDLTCETVIPYIGEWALILEKYGIVCTQGEIPKRLEWDCRFDIDIVKKIFSKKNLARTSDEAGVQSSSIDANTLSNNDMTNANELLQSKLDPIDYASNKFKWIKSDNDNVELKSELVNKNQSAKINMKAHRKKRLLRKSIIISKMPFGIEEEYSESLKNIQNEAEKFLTQLNETGEQEKVNAKNANEGLDNMSDVKPLIQSSNAISINKSKQDINLEKEILCASTENPLANNKLARRSISVSARFVRKTGQPDSIKSIIQGLRNNKKDFFFLFISGYCLYLLFNFLRLPTLGVAIIFLIILLYLRSYIKS